MPMIEMYENGLTPQTQIWVATSTSNSTQMIEHLSNKYLLGEEVVACDGHYARVRNC